VTPWSFSGHGAYRLCANAYTLRVIAVMEGSRQQSLSGSNEHSVDLGLVAPDVLLEGLPDAVVAAGRDGRMVFANSLAEDLFGYSREELVGQPVSMLWPESERQRYVQNMARYFATDHPMRFSPEAVGLRRYGSTFVREMSVGI